MRALPAKKAGVVGGWVADDAEDDFALDVDAGVVVPVELGGGDAVADEDDGSVDGCGGSKGLIGYRVVAAIGELLGCALGGQHGKGGLVGDGFHADEVHLLHVASVSVSGGESGEGELVRDVFCGELAAAEAGIAAFKEVGGDEAVRFANAVGTDGGFGPGERCGLSGSRLLGV